MARGQATDILDLISTMRAKGEPFALATVVRTVAATAAKAVRGTAVSAGTAHDQPGIYDGFVVDLQNDADAARAAMPKSKPAGETVSLPLGDVLPLLADAVRSQRTWLRDFEDDEITISADLYQVLLAYQHFRRPSA